MTLEQANKKADTYENLYSETASNKINYGKNLIVYGTEQYNINKTKSALILVNKLIEQIEKIHDSLATYDGFDFQTTIENLQKVKKVLTERL